MLSSPRASNTLKPIANAWLAISGNVEIRHTVQSNLEGNRTCRFLSEKGKQENKERSYTGDRSPSHA